VRRRRRRKRILLERIRIIKTIIIERKITTP
jgi:hypothetical protein